MCCLILLCRSSGKADSQCVLWSSPTVFEYTRHSKYVVRQTEDEPLLWAFSPSQYLRKVWKVHIGYYLPLYNTFLESLTNSLCYVILLKFSLIFDILEI